MGTTSLRRGGRAVLLAALLGLGLAGPAHAVIPGALSTWHKLPGLNAASGAQWVRAYAYDAVPPTTVYAGLEGGGVFRSTNGGATWSAFNAGFDNPLITNVRAFLVSPGSVLAGTDLGLFRSSNGGAWQPVAQGPEADPANPKKLNQSVQALASMPGTILAGVFSGGVYRSTDDGATWIPPASGNGMPASQTVTAFAVHPFTPGLVYAAAGSGIYRSTDAGATWSLASDGLPGSATPITMWVDPDYPNIYFAGTGSDGVYRSINAGLTWHPINDGLGAVRARGLVIFTSPSGARLYAGTENGVWGAINEHSPAPKAPKWRPITTDGLVEPGQSNLIMWALTAPVVPGAGGAPGIITGTQSNGGYFLAFAPPGNACPADTPGEAGGHADCPDVTGTIMNGKTLGSSVGSNWTGTQTIDYERQWQRCTSTSGNSCTDIANETGPQYVVTSSDVGKYFRMVITATNSFPTFSVVKRYSAISGAAVSNPDDLPGANQSSAPDVDVVAPGDEFDPKVGDKLYADHGITPSAFSDGWFNPKATSGVTFRWLRCNENGNACADIPGAAGAAREYQLVTGDGEHAFRVRVTGTNTAGSTELLSPATFKVDSEPAKIALGPAPDFAPQGPTLIGEAYVGETLAGSVGKWQDPTTVYDRRWVRCDQAGGACTFIQKVASTDPEDGSTYTVRADDVGSTLRMRVTADVNNDTLHNLQPHAVEVDTPPSAVVTTRPVPGGGAGGGGAPGPGPGAAPDTVAPVLSSLSVTNRRFAVATGRTPTVAAAKKGTRFRFRLSERATVTITISRALAGRRVGRSCRKPTRALRKRKRCTRHVRVGALTRRDVAAGAVSVAFTGRIGSKRLVRGRYRASVTARDAAGNRSSARTVMFTVVRR